MQIYWKQNLVQQNGRRYTVLEHQYGCQAHDDMCIHLKAHHHNIRINEFIHSTQALVNLKKQKLN